MRIVLTLTALSALSLGACSTAVEAVRGPELAPIGYPAALVPVQQQYLPAPESRPASANSLWRTGARTFFGGQAFPGGFDPANMVGVQGQANASGSGSVNRSERVSLTIAAVVTDVLPNGNLIIQGRQEVRTNREVRELTVAGIVRPQDISSANSIDHTQIAEARISYGGRGDISRMKATTAAQSLVERFSPF